MARIPKDYIQKIAARLEPGLRRAFERWATQAQAKFTEATIAKALRSGTLDELERRIVEDFRSSGFARQLARATETGAAATLPLVPSAIGPAGQVVRVSFGRQNPFAVRAVRETGRKITEIGDAIREAIRAELREGLFAGLNMRDVGRNIRQHIGLTSGQARTVARVRERLTSGGTDQLQAYLRLKLRDRRYDRAVFDALRTGKPIPQARIDRMVERYAARALKLRAETIARTEGLQALQLGQRALWDASMDQGIVPRAMLRKKWVDATDERVRDSHRGVMDGAFIPLDDDFILPSGIAAREPRDPSLPPEEVINCRCTMILQVDPRAPVQKVEQ